MSQWMTWVSVLSYITLRPLWKLPEDWGVHARGAGYWTLSPLVLMAVSIRAASFSGSKSRAGTTVGNLGSGPYRNRNRDVWAHNLLLLTNNVTSQNKTWKHPRSQCGGAANDQHYCSFDVSAVDLDFYLCLVLLSHRRRIFSTHIWFADFNLLHVMKVPLYNHL